MHMVRSACTQALSCTFLCGESVVVNRWRELFGIQTKRKSEVRAWALEGVIVKEVIAPKVSYERAITCTATNRKVGHCGLILAIVERWVKGRHVI